MTHRALFVGSFDPAAAGALRGWLSAGHEVAGFWYCAPRHPGALRRDRRLAWIAPQWSVTAIARQNGIPLRQIPKPASWPDRVETFAAQESDALISVYFPRLVPQDVLALFGNRAVNLHPAPLPRYRGPTPIHAMVLDRSILTDAAMTLHVMSNGFDEGPIVAQEAIAVAEQDSLMQFRLNAASAGSHLIAGALPAFLDGRLPAKDQDSKTSSYARVSKADLALSSKLDFKTACLLCGFFAAHRALNVEGLPRARVIDVSRVLGPPTGEQPQNRLSTVEMDLLDCRVSAAKRRPWSKLGAEWRNWQMCLRDTGDGFSF